MILVLCVDRDDDLKRKTEIESPVIGKKNNLDAAIALGTADPEEADTNAIFGALNTYDELKEKGYDAEIATICGSKSVGFESDRALTKELEEVLKITKADEVFLVSDGAEDEYILPIITSRVKVSSIRRIVIKQSRNIEDTYYIMKKFFEDEKTQLRFVIPLSLMLIAISTYQIFRSGIDISMWTLIALLIGVYLIVNPLFKLLQSIYGSITAGKVSFLMYIVGVIILVGSFIYIYNDLVNTPGIRTYEFTLGLLEREIGWVLLAFALGAAGRVLDVYLREREILVSYWILFFSLVALWFVVTGSSTLIKYSIKGIPYSNPEFIPVIVEMALGIGIVVVGVVSYGWIKNVVKKLTK